MHGEMPKETGAKTGRQKRRTLIIGLIVIAVAAALIYYFTGTSEPQRRTGGRFGADGGPVPVLAAATSKTDVPVYLDAVGTTKALNTVTVRPQVDGKLLSVGFKEGDDVKKGDVLARIDPTTYQAQLDQAIAKKAQDEATLANARTDLERYERLALTNSINRQQADTQKSLVAQLEAQVKSDQAAIDNTRAILAYTTIVAPIDGRTGIRQVDEGNIVHASDSTGIVMLTQLKPISVLFNLPQQDLNQVNSAFAKGPLAVDAQRSDTDAVIDRGTLRVVDNQVDASTGTVKLKAEFPNADLQLWPGQFVNVRLLIDTLKQVVVIPTGAVQRGPNGTFVYVIKDDNTVTIRPITVQKQDESQTVVSNGVAPPERVVTTGFVRLTDGAKVSISTGGPIPAAPAGPRTRGPRGVGGASGGQRPPANGASGAPPQGGNAPRPNTAQ
jgi:membrane fusion protein, multidrug efflux system